MKEMIEEYGIMLVLLLIGLQAINMLWYFIKAFEAGSL